MKHTNNGRRHLSQVANSIEKISDLPIRADDLDSMTEISKNANALIMISKPQGIMKMSVLPELKSKTQMSDYTTKGSIKSNRMR